MLSSPDQKRFSRLFSFDCCVTVCHNNHRSPVFAWLLGNWGSLPGLMIDPVVSVIVMTTRMHRGRLFYLEESHGMLFGSACALGSKASTTTRTDTTASGQLVTT